MVGKINVNKRQVSSSRLILIFILGGLAAFGPLTIDMYLPAFPLMNEDFGTSASYVQLSLSACLIGLAAGQLLFGPLSDVYGRRKPLMIALGIFVLASLLCAVAPTILILIMLRLIQGLAGAAGIVISRACVRDLYSGAEMTKFFSLLMLISGVAPIAAPVIGGIVLQFTTWRAVFLILAILGFAIFIAILFKLPETLPEENRSRGNLRQTFTIFKHLVKNQFFLGCALIMGFVSGAMFAYIAGSSFVLQVIYDMSPQAYSIVFAINALGIVTCSQIVGKLAGKVSELKLLLIGLTVSGIGAMMLLVAILVNAKLFLVLIALFLVVSSVGLVSPSGVSLAMQSQGKNAGSASALIGLIQFSIGGLMAPLVGISGESTAIPMAIVIICCSLGAASVYLFIVRKGVKNS